jgi:hypothetical protein
VKTDQPPGNSSSLRQIPCPAVFVEPTVKCTDRFTSVRSTDLIAVVNLKGADMHALYVIAAAALLAAPAVATAQTANSSTTVDVEMMPGLVRIVRVDRPIGLIIIGDPSIADTQVLGERGISITALGVGQTSIVLLDDDQEVITTADVSVVPASRGLGSRGVNVRSFGAGNNEYLTHTYFCKDVAGQRTCSFDGSRRNFEPATEASGASSAAAEPR